MSALPADELGAEVTSVPASWPKILEYGSPVKCCGRRQLTHSPGQGVSTACTEPCARLQFYGLHSTRNISDDGLESRRRRLTYSGLLDGILDALALAGPARSLPECQRAQRRLNRGRTLPARRGWSCQHSLKWVLVCHCHLKLL